MTYASEYWDKGLSGIILLDGGNGGQWKMRIQIPSNALRGVDIVDNRFTPEAIQGLIDLAGRQLIYQSGSYAMDNANENGAMSEITPLLIHALNSMGIPIMSVSIPHYPQVSKDMTNDPLAPPKDPVTGKFLQPYDPKTKKPFSSYLEWASEVLNEDLWPNLFTNLAGGENTRLGLGYIAATFDRYWPLEVYLESVKMYKLEITTNKEPYGIPSSSVIQTMKDVPKPNADIFLKEETQPIPHYEKNFKNINVPLIRFASRLGLLLWGSDDPGIASKDYTNGGEYPFLGHLDTYIGTHNDELINGPALDWLNRHTKAPKSDLLVQSLL